MLLKVLTPEAAEDPSLVAWLEREAAAVAAVDHPNVVALYASGHEDGRPYLVTEFVEGRSLTQALEAHGPLPPELAAWVAAETARGLAAAHAAGLLHRDLKPANVLLGDDGHVKLADFGLASRVDAPEGGTGEVRGTPGYLAPEAVRGAAVGPPADLFALGATLAEALTGRLAFPAPTVPAALGAALHHDPVPALRADLRLPAGLVDIVQRLVAKDPGARPSAAEAADALDACRAIRGTGFRADAGALAAWLADPDGYVAARPVPPTLVTAMPDVAGSGVPVAAVPAAAPPAAVRPLVSAPPARRRFVRPALLTGALVALVALVMAAVRTGSPPAPPLTDHPDSLVVTLPLPLPDTLGGPSAAPITALPAESSAASPLEREEPPEPEPAPEREPIASVPEEAAPPPSPSSPPSAPEPARGQLVVAVQPWAEVWVDGRKVGEGALVTVPSLEAGEHRVELRNAQFPTVQRRVTVAGGAEERLDVSLWEEVGRITIQVHPWAEVSVDGGAPVVIPPQQEFTLAPGTHTLRLTHPALGTWTGTVTVRRGERRTLPLNLAQLLGGS